MSKSREVSQFSNYIYVDGSNGNVGIATTLSPNIGIGTPNPTSKFHVVGNSNFVGIVTATSFVGDITGNVNSSGVSTFTTLKVGTAVTISGGIVTATSFVGDGSALTNTGSTLSAASGSQRVVLTGQTSGTMTASATDSGLTFSQSTGTLSASKFSGNLSGNVNSVGVSTFNNVVVGGATTALNVTGGTRISGDLTLDGQSDLRLSDADSSNWVALQAPATVSSNVTWTLPATDGAVDQLLKTNGSGILSWASIVGSASTVYTFTSSGTWTKPSTGTFALVIIWGGGGGGGNYTFDSATPGGGGGGACVHRLFTLTDLPSTVSITVGSGGAAQSTGGTSSFGALINAYGGGPGGPGNAGSPGGGGGGSLGAGGQPTGGSGHSPSLTGASAGGKGDFGGGGGNGGNSYWGGGGGNGGVSLCGGNGGAASYAGSVPGGGGGGFSMPGGAGKCLIYVW